MKAEDFKIGQRVQCIYMKGKPWELLNKIGTVVSINIKHGYISVQFDRQIKGNKLPWLMEPYQLKAVTV